MCEKYAIVLKSPMGPKKGFLYLRRRNSVMEGTLECLGKEHLLVGTLSGDGALLLEGILKAPLGDEPFTISGIIRESMLTARFMRQGGMYELAGTKMNEK